MRSCLAWLSEHEKQTLNLDRRDVRLNPQTPEAPLAFYSLMTQPCGWGDSNLSCMC